MNIKELLKKLSPILNPETNESFFTEKRIQELKIEDQKLHITYRRDGISPLQKREIEKKTLEVLKSDFESKDIFLKTISNRSEEVYKSIPAQKPEQMVAPKKDQPAQIKTGHGSIGNKKRIPGVKNVIAVGSGKGGVGKSTLSVNLAKTLALKGKKVGLIDADIYGPSLPKFLNMEGQKPLSNSDKKIIPLEAHGIHFISFGLFINPEDAVIWRGPMLGGVLNQFFFDVDWNGFDYLIIDLPPGTGDVQLSMVQNIELDGSIIVSTPQDMAMIDARRAIEMFRKLNINILGLVENMSHFICSNCDTKHTIFGENSLKETSKTLDLDYLGAIPLELSLRKTSDEGLPYMANPSFEGKEVWKSYEEIVSKILG